LISDYYQEDFVDSLSGLGDLGFTEYEAKVYLALLRENPANGYQLSKKAGVPRSMVYEALGRLHARGAVLKSGNERSIIYRPLPPEELLDRYDRQHQQLISALRDDLLSLYDSKGEESLWTVSGREASFGYASKMIADSKNEVYLVLDDTALERLRDEILSANQRGIKIGVLLTGFGELDCGKVSYHPPEESELQGLDDMVVVVVDGEECLIADMKHEMTATITTSRNMVLITRQFVWMELFAQRINERINPDLLDQLEETDRKILQSFSK
jgi:sugar-specific transcriptional regulator TrmB